MDALVVNLIQGIIVAILFCNLHNVFNVHNIVRNVMKT